MGEVEEASKIITEQADADANIIFGATISEIMVDQIKITVIATGFDESKIKLQKMLQKTQVSSTEVKTPSSENKEEMPPTEIPPEKIGEEYEVPAFLRLGRQQ